MRLRHALVLAINTSLLVVLFVFTAWLYRASRDEVVGQVGVSLERAAAMTDRLAALREGELSGIAHTLSGSALVRGALITDDPATIADVLRTIRDNNGLAWAGVARDGVVIHASAPLGKARSLRELTAGRLLGQTPVAGRGTLVLAQAPEPGLLSSWSQITDVAYVLRAGGGVIAHNLPSEDSGLAEGPPPAGAPAAAGPYYVRRARLLEGRFEALLLSPREPYWSGFRKRRNSLVVLGGVLFLFGIGLSVAFAVLIERHAAARPDASPAPDWSRLLSEIEALKRRVPSP